MSDLTLSPVEVMVLSKACGDALVAKSRALIENDTTHEIDVTLRITGTLIRGPAIPDSTKLVQDKLWVDQEEIHARTLKKLGVKLNDYRAAYQAAESRALDSMAKKQKSLPHRKVSVPGRAGDINVKVDIQKIP